MRQIGRAVRTGVLTGRLLAFSLVLILASVLVPTSSPVLAQADGPPVGSTVLVANTGGQRLNLRAGPSTDQPIRARLLSGEKLTVTGPSQTVGMTRWVPVRAAGQTGWVSSEFVVLLSTPTSPSPSVAETAPVPPLVGATEGSTEQTAHDSRADESRGGQVDVEAKLKFPEVQGREQEITVWVTRGGVPVPGAIVTLESSDGGDAERFRQLDPTNDEGWTRRSFDVRRETGTVELQVEAVAPDGGEGRVIVSYFRR